MGQWFAKNGVALAFVVALIGFILYRFELDEQLAILKAALGLSFVIFIHELGHFLVAKWCDVHVTAFSIGFGPVVPGCWFQWGETTYKLAVFPLGGYVQMVGQVDGDEGSDGSEDDPRSYRAKSVGQRMAIISAGVIMNVILAIVCFIVVFRGPGKDRAAAVVGQVDTGAPAMIHGVRTGAEITKIGEIDYPYWDDLLQRVTYTDKGESITFWAKRPQDAEAFKDEIEPRFVGEDARPLIGMRPAGSLRFMDRLPARIKSPTLAKSVAALVPNGFERGDEIVATTDAVDPTKVTELPLDTRHGAGKQRDYFEFQRRMELLAEKPVVIVVERGEKKERHSITVPPAYRQSLGIRMKMGPVTTVRRGSPADQAQIRVPANGLEGDLIVKVVAQIGDEVTKDALILDDQTTPPLDPERLPLALRKWALAHPKADRKIVLTVRRHLSAKEAAQQYKDTTLVMKWEEGWSFDQQVPISSSSPLAIPELGLAYEIKTMIDSVESNAVPGASQLRKNDRITNYKLNTYDAFGNIKEGDWLKEEMGRNEWANFSYVWLQSPAPIAKIVLRVDQGDPKPAEIEITPQADPFWPLAERGWLLSVDERRQIADSTGEAILFGLKDTKKSMLQVFQNLRQMIVGRVSVKKNLGGPLAIAEIAYRIAGYDFWEFVFFLGLISVNLAVINFLPIPVLDGGHMVFLIYEGIRGKPASETVRVVATYTGLALILALMLFVLYLDFSRILKW